LTWKRLSEEARTASNVAETCWSRAEESLAQLGDVDPARAEDANQLFDWNQNAAEIWQGSNNRDRREILDLVCLNRTLSDVNLYTTMRKPSDVLAKRLDSEKSRGDKTPLELFRHGVEELQTSQPKICSHVVAVLA